MRTYHDDFLKHLCDAEIAKNQALMGLFFDRIYNSKKAGWKIIENNNLKRPLFDVDRYWCKDDADFILSHVNLNADPDVVAEAVADAFEKSAA